MQLNSQQDLDSFVKAASDKGMYLVDHSNISALIEEFKSTIPKVDKLCEVVDPEDTPFNSKYDARKLLDEVCNKLEATRTILVLENKKESIAEVDWRIACCRVRLGTIAWECEEPHNTQIELDMATDFYFPDLREKIQELSRDKEGSSKDYSNIESDLASLPKLVVSDNRRINDAMKCLNMMGILWAGREHVKESFLYLYSAKALYDYVITETPQISLSLRGGEVDVKALEDLYTHNLFYLAQAYGHVGQAHKSCR